MKFLILLPITAALPLLQLPVQTVATTYKTLTVTEKQTIQKPITRTFTVKQTQYAQRTITQTQKTTAVIERTSTKWIKEYATTTVYKASVTQTLAYETLPTSLSLAQINASAAIIQTGTYILKSAYNDYTLQFSNANGQALFPASGPGSPIDLLSIGSYTMISPAQSNNKCCSAAWDYDLGANFGCVLYSCIDFSFSSPDFLIQFPALPFPTGLPSVSLASPLVSSSITSSDSRPSSTLSINISNTGAISNSLGMSVSSIADEALLPTSSGATTFSSQSDPPVTELAKRQQIFADVNLRPVKQLFKFVPGNISGTFYILQVDHENDEPPRALTAELRRAPWASSLLATALEALDTTNIAQLWYLLPI